ncbi:MAG: hypothetical protein HYU66_15045, partial [Armatimonadetes bacterium]|nr:hypothetical protein [Armatimonadota bacterium]
METGITHLVLRGRGELADVLPWVKVCGYDGMEVLLTDDGDITPASTQADCDKVRRLFDAQGMSLQSMCIATTKGRGSLVTGVQA